MKTGLKNLAVGMLQICLPTSDQSDVNAIASIHSATQRREEATTLAEALFKFANPYGAWDITLKSIILLFQFRFGEVQRVLKRAAKLDQRKVSIEASENQHRTAFHMVYGALVAVILLIGLSIPPITAAMLLGETQKINMLADYPWMGIIFGGLALGGLLASIQFRNTLKTDDARAAYDRFMVIAAVATFVIWMGTLALVAYPIMIGGEEVVTTLGRKTIVGGFELSAPMAVFMLLTACLDVLAAPVMHRIAEQILTPDLIEHVQPSEPYDYDTKQLAREFEPELRELAFERDQLEALPGQWEAAKTAFVMRFCARVEQRRAQIEAASAAAVLNLMNTPEADTHTSNGAAHGPLANGDARHN